MVTDGTEGGGHLGAVVMRSGSIHSLTPDADKGFVIPLLKSIHDVEHSTVMHDAAAKTLALSIEACGHYAVELNPHDAGTFRRHLTELATQVDGELQNTRRERNVDRQ